MQTNKVMVVAVGGLQNEKGSSTPIFKNKPNPAYGVNQRQFPLS